MEGGGRKEGGRGEREEGVRGGRRGGRIHDNPPGDIAEGVRCNSRAKPVVQANCLHRGPHHATNEQNYREATMVNWGRVPCSMHVCELELRSKSAPSPNPEIPHKATPY